MRRLAPLLLLAALAAAVPARAGISAPEGVTVAGVASGLPGPSNIAFDSRGRIWATSSGYGSKPSDGVWFVPRRGARPRHVVRGLLYALGLTWHRGRLYVVHAFPRRLQGSHTGRVVAYSGFTGRRFKRKRVVVKDLPVGLHNADSIVPGPGGRLYLGIGSQSDNRASPRRLSATVVSFRPDGSRLRVEARGLRNPYGLAFVPGTDTLLVSDNGRDDLGAGRPPDELNAVDVSGRARFYGFPRCWGSSGGRCRGSVAPLANLPRHAAAAGVAVSEDWAGEGPRAFIAQNGSNFSSAATGHDVQTVPLALRGGRVEAAGRAERFAGGFERYDPVGTAIGPDGHLYVTLHRSGRIVRFEARAPAPSRTARSDPDPRLVRALGVFGALLRN